MHGIVMNQMRQFVVATQGRDAWDELAAAAGIAANDYSLQHAYPDEHVVAVAVAASERAQVSLASLLEDFGAFLVPGLVRIYGAMIDPDWGTLDLLEHTEVAMHTVVRMRDASATPPALVCERLSPVEVRITYASPRRMCALARGIVRGLADHYGDAIEIEEPTCIHRGDAACTLSVFAA